MVNIKEEEECIVNQMCSEDAPGGAGASHTTAKPLNPTVTQVKHISLRFVLMLKMEKIVQVLLQPSKGL